MSIPIVFALRTIHIIHHKRILQILSKKIHILVALCSFHHGNEMRKNNVHPISLHWSEELKGPQSSRLNIGNAVGCP